MLRNPLFSTVILFGAIACLSVSSSAQTSPTNVALAANGGVASASSTYGSGYPASAVNDGDIKGLNVGSGGNWADSTANTWPDWVEIDFSSSKTIYEIDVFTLQDDFNNPVTPTATLTFSIYGITAFDVQYWNGSAWTIVPNGSITGNNLVWRQFTFSPITTGKIRISVNNSLATYSRIVEVQAWQSNNSPTVALTAPANNASLTTPVDITLTATASVTGGTISKVEFFQGSTKVGESDSSPYSFVWTGVAAGSYTLTAKATESLGASATSSAVNILVTGPHGTIAGTVTRTDGVTPITQANITITQGSAVAGAATTDSNGNYSVPSLPVGTYSVQASAFGCNPAIQSGVAVSDSNTTTINLSLTIPISYAYDDLGRLVAVVDAAAGSAVYSYDAVGNLLSISRNGPGAASIINFSPASGPVGATVTINGTGFSLTPGQNAVTFNGTSAAVVSATTTQIVTTVPVGATTGGISITSPAGTASSSAAFTVTTSGSAPTITSFSPTIGVIGTAVTVTGTNFDPVAANDRPAFNVSGAAVSAASATSLSTTVPPAGSGHISVATPNGAAVSSGDFFIPPDPYGVSDVATTARIAIGGGTTVTIGTGGAIGLVLFDGTQGQRVYLSLTSVTLNGTAAVVIYNTDGTALASQNVSFNTSSFIDATALPATGTYTIMVAMQANTTGSVTLTLSSVAPDIVATLTPGVPATANITTAGQNVRFSFAGTAGQRISLLVANGTLTGNENLTIFNPDGTVYYATGVSGSGAFIDTQTLGATGTYTILFDPFAAGTGSTTLTLYNVVDITGGITIGGAGVPLLITTPGQNAQFTFSGTANQKISLLLTGITFTANTPVTIFKPDGTTLAAISAPTTPYLDATTLPVSGTYTMTIDPPGPATGNMTLTLYDATPLTGTITAGTPQTVTIMAPGQNETLTFSGTAGQRISLYVTAVSIGNTIITIYNPDGTTLAATTSGNGWLDSTALPATGTYSILVDPAGTATGSLTLTLYNFTDVTGTLTINGSSLGVTIATPGQNAQLTFSGTAGQAITIQAANNTIGLIAVKLLSPSGTLLTQGVSSNSSFNTPYTLPSAGTYTIVVDPNFIGTGSVTISVTSP